MKDDDPEAKKWAFEPAALTVAAGTEVTFRNEGVQPHNVVGRRQVVQLADAVQGRGVEVHLRQPR